MSEASLLEVDDLHVRFTHDAGELHAVNGVTLRLAEGETLGIVGESGSGKSVLSRAVMGLLPRSARIPEGQIRFAGHDMRAGGASRLWGREVAMVFQDPMTSLTPTVRVGRQVTEPLRHHLGLGRRDAEAKALELLAQVGIPEPGRRLAQYPHELSGGMRQRVTIAIALSCSPRLLIADEPTTALDVTIQHQVLNTLTKVRDERQMAMVLITHDLGVVANRTDTIAVMYAGRVVERAPTKVLFDEVRHPYTMGLLGSIPRVVHRSHTRLTAIPGRPPAVLDLRPGCAFAPRCRFAQPRCTEETPVLTPVGHDEHDVACFYPVGTDAGADALARNLGAGTTATGLPVVA